MPKVKAKYWEMIDTYPMPVPRGALRAKLRPRIRVSIRILICP